MAPPDIKPGPVTRVCHVCGRQYGLSSFDIHLKQCKKLFIAQEELKPRNERRQLPKTPPGLDGGAGGRGGSRGGGGDLGETNDASSGERPTREMIEAMNRAAQDAYSEHGMEKCENCGRRFAEGRLAIHAKSCRPGNAARRVDDGVAPRNKKDIGVDYGSTSPAKKSAPRATASEQNDKEDVSPSRPATSASASGGGGASRPLAGSLASNRKKIVSQSSSSGNLQSPLGSTEVDLETLKQELAGKEGSMIGVIQAKLDHCEATTLATLQEIRDLKQLFAGLQS